VAWLEARCSLATAAPQPQFQPQPSGSGARFPTEMYTRECHWIPRMFA
jgi:hypothetical protein